MIRSVISFYNEKPLKGYLMFGKPDKAETLRLNAAVNRILIDMQEADPNSEQYKELLTNLERLTTLRSNGTPSGFSRDTMLTVAANIVGILIIVGYEQTHVISSKGLGFLPKMK